MILPTSRDNDGSASWEYEPFEVIAEPGDPMNGMVTVDGQRLSAATARQLGEVLLSAADHAEGKTT